MSSWWDTTGFTNLASQALKNAQKKIDKVLDIEEDERRKASMKRKSSKSAQKSSPDNKAASGSDGDFWSTWMSPKSSTTDEESETKTSAGSSWSLPWGIASTSEAANKKHEEETKKDDFKEVELFTPASETSNLVTPKSTDEIIEESPESKEDVDSSDVVESIKASDEFPQHSSTPHSPDGVSAEGNVSCADNSALEGKIDLHVPEKEEIDVKENSKMKGFVDSSYMEVSNMSGDSSGWDISDSVLKLVEMDEKLNSQETESETDTSKGSDHASKDTIESRERDTEESAFSKPVQSSCRENSESVEDTTKIREDDHEIKSQIVSDSNIKGTVSSDFLGDEISEDIQKCETQMHQSQPRVEGIESETIHETVPENTDSKRIHEDAVEETSITPESSTPPLSSERLKIGEATEVSPAEEPKIQSDLTQDYINIQSCELALSCSDITQPASNAEISRSSSDLDANAGSTESSETSRLDSSADTIVEKVFVEPDSDEQKDKPYSLFSSEKTVEDKDTSQSDLSKSLSPASSYVKCMLEDAMEESGKEDSGSDNHSNESKSESSKVDSELEKSVYSGHESSDDIETTTSSDIEIISAPLVSSSEKQFNPSYDLPALKINLQPRHGGTERKGHHRSDSQSSSSTQSKGGDHERLSPDRGDGNGWADEELQHADLEAVQEEGTDNPYHPERLLKLSKNVVDQQMAGGQKLAEMAEVLQARETKLVQMSKDNHQLMEDNSILRNQLQQSEDAREAETADLKALTDEFTVRIGESEKKLQAALRDKESLKKQLTSVQSELDKRAQGSDLEALLEEKTDQVNELMAEGEKLSKQQLQSSNIIKKLRAKEKETDTTLTSQKKKLEEQTKELDRLTVVLDSKEQMEAKQSEAITQLNAAVQRQERDHSKALSDLEDAQEKTRGLQTALDNAYKEIAELHRSNASQDSKAQETALSVETSVREELRIAMEREQMRFRQEREAFIMQADDLRLDMARLEKEHERREDLLREEIAHLQERLQQDEARSQDLSQSITSATRPLLRQIENLQATFGAQSKAWEKVEKNLTDRLAEGQTALAMAQEKERTATENYMEISAKLASFEMTNTRLKQEKANLVAQKEADEAQLEDLQEVKNSISAQLETSKKILNQEISQLKIEKVQLESQLNLEKNKLESEKKKCVALEEQVTLAAERERSRSRGTPSPSPSMSVSRQESLVGSFHEYNALGMKWPYNDDTGEAGSGIMAASKSSVYESLRQSGATVVMENLQSQLKLREGEIVQLQSDIAQLERTRESMARELVNLTNQNEELQESKVAFENLKEQFQELNNRYSAILLMYGEKEEQVQELRLDLQDVKEMYKTQIDALLAK